MLFFCNYINDKEDYLDIELDSYEIKDKMLVQVTKNTP